VRRGWKIRGNVPPQASAGCPFGKHLLAVASRWRGECAPACLNVGRLHDGPGTRKKVESTNLRSHGICVVVSQPRVTDEHGKRFPCTGRHTSARSSLPRQFSSKRTNKSSPPSSPPCCLRHWLHCHPQVQRKNEPLPSQNCALSFSILVSMALAGNSSAVSKKVSSVRPWANHRTTNPTSVCVAPFVTVVRQLNTRLELPQTCVGSSGRSGRRRGISVLRC
jgi:hypothetical protein